MDRVRLASSAGELEGLLEIPAGFTGLAGVVLCHPHPLYGGTMRHKVLARLSSTFAGLGAAVIRFNFRGVEQSEGSHDHGRGELDDAMAAMDYLAGTVSPRHLILGGFSFGAWVAARVAVTRREAAFCLSVGTPARMYDYRFLESLHLPTLFVQGDRDDFGSPAEIFALSQLDPLFQLATVPGADHFFTGRLPALQEAVAGFFLPVLDQLGRLSGP